MSFYPYCPYFFTGTDKIRGEKCPRTAVRQQLVSCGEIHTLPQGVKQYLPHILHFSYDLDKICYQIHNMY